MNISFNLFCPIPTCPYYNRTDNIIIKDGKYSTKSDTIPRQLFYCKGGFHKFSETAYSELFKKHGSFKEYEQSAKLIKYGNSIEATADILDRDVRTIHSWVNAISKKSSIFHFFICSTVGLILNLLQMDELWSYCNNKAHQLWVFIALEAQTKFWIYFELGSRTTNTAKRLLKIIIEKIKINCIRLILVTTDKLAAYNNSLKIYFSHLPYSYLQVVKSRIKYRLQKVTKYFVKGSKNDFPQGTQNTSFIERFNLTLRQRVSFLKRKTLGYAKKKSNCNNILWINLFDYNYIQHHKSLRIKMNNFTQRFHKCYLHITPAIAMGLVEEQLAWRFLFTVPIRQN